MNTGWNVSPCNHPNMSRTLCFCKYSGKVSTLHLRQGLLDHQLVPDKREQRDQDQDQDQPCAGPKTRALRELDRAGDATGAPSRLCGSQSARQHKRREHHHTYYPSSETYCNNSRTFLPRKLIPLLKLPTSSNFSGTQMACCKDVKGSSPTYTVDTSQHLRQPRPMPYGAICNIK